MKSYTRYIDRVTVKGSIRPIGLYTVDMDVDNLPVKKEIDPNFTKYDIVSFISLNDIEFMISFSMESINLKKRK